MYKRSRSSSNKGCHVAPPRFYGSPKLTNQTLALVLFAILHSEAAAIWWHCRTAWNTSKEEESVVVSSLGTQILQMQGHTYYLAQETTAQNKEHCFNLPQMETADER